MIIELYRKTPALETFLVRKTQLIVSSREEIERGKVVTNAQIKVRLASMAFRPMVFCGPNSRTAFQSWAWIGMAKAEQSWASSLA